MPGRIAGGRVAVRALIIDDSPVMRRVIRHHLEQLGCKIVGEAENGARAMKSFARLKPQLVTLDVMMPEVGGVDALSAFRTFRKAAPDTAIVLITSLPAKEVRNTFLKEGALACLTKTFDDFSLEPIRPVLMKLFPELRRTRKK
jgi:two-component system, chemotaxis family, chemotaxis protein CheY